MKERVKICESVIDTLGDYSENVGDFPEVFLAGANKEGVVCKLYCLNNEETSYDSFYSCEEMIDLEVSRLEEQLEQLTRDNYTMWGIARCYYNFIGKGGQWIGPVYRFLRDHNLCLLSYESDKSLIYISKPFLYLRHFKDYYTNEDRTRKYTRTRKLPYEIV